jgi:TonB family protein
MQSCSLVSASVLICASAVVAHSADAQSVELHGLVTDSAGVPVVAAIVEVPGTDFRTRTNEQGEFRVTGQLGGVLQMQIRRIGFAALTQSFTLNASQLRDPVRIMLAAIPTNVQPVVVQAARANYPERLAGYYERLRRRSNGSFITREQLDRSANKTLSQLMSATPGVHAVRLGTGNAVRMRGMRCRPLVWIDGVPMPAGEVDLDAFPVTTLQGVEMYLGATNAPPAFSPPPGISSCGTVLLWSRGRDTETADLSRMSVDLEELAASHAIYTHDQVDTPARLEKQTLDIRYPSDLAASRTSGSAVAEFIVSENGEIERGSMDIVSATHPLFAQAAMHALVGAHFSPAVKSGAPVRQLVQQPFTFSVDADSIPPSARR